jgi:hypothetical protein
LLILLGLIGKKTAKGYEKMKVVLFPLYLLDRQARELLQSRFVRLRTARIKRQRLYVIIGLRNLAIELQLGNEMIFGCTGSI